MACPGQITLVWCELVPPNRIGPPSPSHHTSQSLVEVDVAVSREDGEFVSTRTPTNRSALRTTLGELAQLLPRRVQDPDGVLATQHELPVPASQVTNASVLY